MKIIILLITLPFTVNAFDLNGEWVQDKKRTNEFNDKYSMQTPLNKTLYNCSNESLIFNSGIVTIKIKDYPCEYNGKKTVIKGFNNSSTYKMIGKNPYTIILESKNKDTEVGYGIYHIVSDNIIWLYTGSSGDESHFRHYYKRNK